MIGEVVLMAEGVREAVAVVEVDLVAGVAGWVEMAWET